LRLERCVFDDDAQRVTHVEKNGLNVIIHWTLASVSMN
jgi:hypothetical protein